MAARKRNKKRVLDSGALERPEPQLDLFAAGDGGRTTRYYCSTRLENLLDALSHELRETRPADFFARAPAIWVPNRNLRRWIQMTLAEREGVAAHLDFQFLETGLWQLLLALDPRQDRPLPLDRVDLEYLVLSVLEELVAGDEAVFAPFREYLGDERGPRKLVQLAARLAALFQEYEYHRGDMVAGWLEVPALSGFAGDSSSTAKNSGNDLPKTAAIYGAQRELYRRVFGVGRDREGGRVRALDRFGDQSLSLAAYARLVLIDRRDDLRPLERAVHIFGMSQMSAFHLDLLSELSEWLDLRFYLNFAPEHWRRALGRPRFVSPSAKARGESTIDFASRWSECAVDSAIDSGAETQSDSAGRDAGSEADTPAERLNDLWARPACELLQLLAGHRREHHRFFWDARDREAFEYGVAVQNGEDAADRETDSVLRALQRELFYGDPAKKGVVAEVGAVHEPDEAPPKPGRLQDASIQIIACPGLRREAETIYQNILFQMQRDPTLRLTDIAVLVPDMQTYRPVLQAVFDADRRPDGGLRVPYNLSDFSAGDASVYGAGVATLLNLFDSQFTRRDLFSLFFNPCFLAAHRLHREDALAWLEWADELQVFRAMDAGHQRELGIQTDARFTWERALQRLRLGTVMSSPRGSGDFRSFAGLVPHSDLASGEGDAIGILSAICADLYYGLRECAGAFAANDLRAFDLLRDFIDRHLQAPEDRPGESGVRVGAFSALHRLSRHASATGRLPGFALLREVWNAQIGGVAGNRGNYLAGGVTIAALQPMRPIPFRVVYVPGMGEGDFPGHPDLSVLNLRNLERRIGDASTPQSNRMLFLENLLSVRDRLYLSYVSRDIQRDADYHPCSVVTELTTALARFCDGEGDTVYREARVPLRLTGEEHLFFEANDESDALACYSTPDRVLALRRFVSRNPDLELEQRERLAALIQRYDARTPHTPSIDGGDTEAVLETAAADPDAIRLRDLREFLRDPMSALLRRRLGLFDEFEQGARALEEDEILFLDARARRWFLREALDLHIRGGGAKLHSDIFAGVFDDARLRDRVPRGAFGELERTTLQREFVERAGRIQAVCGDVQWLPELRFGAGDRGAFGHGSYASDPPVNVPVQAKAGSDSSREIHASVTNLFIRAGELHANPGLMQLSFASRVRTEDFLAGFLSALLLRSAAHAILDQLPPSLADCVMEPFEVTVIARNESRRIFVEVPPEPAAAYLRELAADFARGRFETLPLALIEHRAVSRRPHLRDQKPKSTQAPGGISYADELRNVWEDHGDDFYQMDLARLLPARFPADAEIIVRRRYELFFACLAAEAKSDRASNQGGAA